MDQAKKDTVQNLNMSLDYDDMERNDLLSGEPRYIEDEIRNTQFALIFGALAAVFIIITMVMTWVLYYRERTRTFLWHGIFLIFALLVAGLAAAWGAMSKGSISAGRAPSAVLTNLVFILSGIFAVYLFVESIWLVMYRPVHFNYLLGLFTKPETWNQRQINGSSFEQGWRTNRRMMWWIVFFDILSALCFTYIVYATRSVSLNRFSITKLALYVALVWAVWSGFMVCYWVEESYTYQNAFPNVTSFSLLKTLKVIAIISIVLATLNALVALLRSKVGYFIISALEIVALLVFICAAGTLLRQTRVHAFEEQDTAKGCIQTMSSIHENDIESWCPFDGKYLAKGTQCSKDYVITRWEADNETRTLNPACCGLAKFFYLYPFMLTGYWSLFVIVCLAIAITCNIYLASANEYLTTSNSRLGIADFAAIGLILAIIIGWVIYFIVRKANALKHSTNINQNSYEDPGSYNIPEFTKVPASIIALSQSGNDQVNNDGCYAYDPATHSVPSFSTDATKNECVDPNTCIQRVAILLNGAKLKIVNPSATNQASQGSLNSRDNFFPDCTSQSADYVFYYGTPQQVSKLFTQLRVCPTGNAAPSIKLYHDQVKKESIGTTGLKTTENAIQAPATGADGVNCGKDFVSSTTCAGKCQVVFTSKTDVKLYNVKGKLFYLRDGAAQSDIHPQVIVEAYRNGNKVGSSSTIVSGGIFIISDVERYAGSSYILTLKIVDSINRFDTKEVDLLVDRDIGADLEIPAGSIRLVTKDGKICPNDDKIADCVKNQTLKYGAVNIVATDSSSLDTDSESTPADDVKFTAIKGHKFTGISVSQVTTDNTGKATFKNLPYGSYMLIANKTGFRPEYLPVDVQDATINPRTFILKPTIDGSEMRVVAYFNEPEADFDLNLKMTSDDGKTSCTVSPTNKYCPYAASINDIARGSGEETILVRKLAVATYASYISPAPSYTGTCAFAGPYEANFNQYHAQSTWNWLDFKAKRPLATLDISSSTFTSRAASVVNSAGVAIGQLSQPRFVETIEEAKKIKEIISINGVKVVGQNMTTFFTSFERAGASLGIFGWPNSTGNWVNTTVKNTTAAPVVTTIEGGKLTTSELEISSKSTEPLNLTTTYSRKIENKAFDSGSSENLTTVEQKTESLATGAYYREENITLTSFDKAKATNTSDVYTETETRLANKTVTVDTKQVVNIIREATSVDGNETVTEIEKIVTASAIGDYTLVYTSKIVTGEKATARNEVSNYVSMKESGVDVTVNDTTVSRIAKETNDTSSQLTIRSIIKITTLLNGSTMTNTTTVTTTTYNLKKDNQATKQTTVVKGEIKLADGTKYTWSPEAVTVAKRRMLLTAAHEQASTAADSILVSCFTGYGEASLLRLNTPVTGVPDMNECLTKLAKDRPNFTAAKLRAAVKEFLDKNPAYKEEY